MLKFFIVASGYNCAPLVKKCVDSVKNQTYPHFEAVFISDGSTDHTGEEVSVCTEGKTKLHNKVYGTNMGAAKRRYDAIKEYVDDEETVILFLGLDDELLPHCLERIKREYDNGKWMTYGNWKDQTGWMLPNGFLKFDKSAHRSRSYRMLKYRATAPNTFKRFLFDQLTEDDFKINGKWIDTTTESNLMFSCLEMCGGEARIGMIQDPIYLYNRNLPGGTLKRLGVKYKYDVYAHVIKMPVKPVLIR